MRRARLLGDAVPSSAKRPFSAFRTIEPEPIIELEPTTIGIIELEEEELLVDDADALRSASNRRRAAWNAAWADACRSTLYTATSTPPSTTGSGTGSGGSAVAENGCRRRRRALPPPSPSRPGVASCPPAIAVGSRTMLVLALVVLLARVTREGMSWSANELRVGPR